MGITFSKPSGGSVDGTAINPLSIGATTPVQSVDIQPLVNGTHTFRVRNIAGNEIIDANTTTRTVTFGGESLAVNAGTGLTTIYNNGALAWTPSSGASGGSEDLFLLRDAAGILAQRNGTNAQESRLYGTYTSSTVYERLSSKYDSGSGAFVIGTEKGASGGSARPLVVQNSSNMAVAFAVRNVAGTDVLGVDTTNRFVQLGGDVFGVSTTTGSAYLYNNGSIVWSTGSTASGGPSTPGPSMGVCTGSPEGVVAAPVGSVRMRSDGGAGTSFYVKESGAGNTGWVAK